MDSPQFFVYCVLANLGLQTGADGLIRLCLSKDKKVAEKAVKTLTELGVTNSSVELAIFQSFMQNRVPGMDNSLACIMGSIFAQKHTRGMEIHPTASRLMRMIKKRRH